MAVVSDWSDPVGGLGTAMSQSTIDGVDTAEASTNAFPFMLPNKYITIYARSTSTLAQNATFQLLGTYDGSEHIIIVSDIIATSNLSSVGVGTFNLEQYSALSYKIQITTTGDETGKDITFYLVYETEV